MTESRSVDRPSEPERRQADPPELRDGALRPSARYIALKWELSATYHDSWSEAEASIADLPASQRAGIVDSLTGRTLASQASYPAVEAAISGEVLGIMSREGVLGDLVGERR